MSALKELFLTTLISFASFFGWQENIPTNTPQTNIPEQRNEEVEKIIDKEKLQPITKKIPEKKAPINLPKKENIKTTATPPKTTVLPKPEIKVAEQKTAEVFQEQNITIEQKIKNATANIFCSIPKGNQVQKITGSAVAISNNGVLLTNAHVAEHILIENTHPSSNVLCYVRTGSPAKKAYKANVIFLPKEWINLNKDNLKYSSLTGTGENDYALIYLTKKIEESTANNLSFMKPDTSALRIGENLILSGYPVLGGKLNENSLYNISQKIEVQDIWRFNQTESDAISTTATTLATHGSSGGAGASPEGELKGIMVATTIDKLTGKLNMRLISLGYISADIQNKTGKSFSSIIQNAEQESNNFINGEGINLANILISNSN